MLGPWEWRFRWWRWGRMCWKRWKKTCLGRGSGDGACCNDSKADSPSNPWRSGLFVGIESIGISVLLSFAQAKKKKKRSMCNSWCPRMRTPEKYAQKITCQQWFAVANTIKNCTKIMCEPHGYTCTHTHTYTHYMRDSRLCRSRDTL